MSLSGYQGSRLTSPGKIEPGEGPSKPDANSRIASVFVDAQLNLSSSGSKFQWQNMIEMLEPCEFESPVAASVSRSVYLKSSIYVEAAG